jgi:uncharacterized protein YjiS (DUF1127 family)
MMAFEKVTKKIAGWKRYNATVRELSLLSDRELSDIGIARPDIRWIAAQTR